MRPSLRWQYVFVDCPAGIDLGFLNAIAPAKEAVIVTTPEITSIRDADRVAGKPSIPPAPIHWARAASQSTHMGSSLIASQ